MCDQHAAHEKVMFERIMKQYRERKPSTQLIMPAIVLNLSLQQEHLLKEHMDLFTALGYEIEEFGSGAIKVTGVPAELPKNLDLKQLLVDVIDGLEQDGTGTDAVTMRIASMSCKAAVKGNSKMSFKEAEYLIRELMTLENPYNCPHGRPTMIVMTQYELEKKFKRIV
jgi:DNA mismatch repair protein MutL